MQIIFSLDQILSIIAAIIFWICSFLFSIKAKIVEDKSNKKFFIGVSIFFLFWGIMRIFFLIAYMYLNIDLIIYSLWWKIASISGIISILAILLVMETYLVKSRYIFSIITIIGLILVIILPIYGTEISYARLASYIFFPAGGFSIVILYLYLFFKVPGKDKRTIGLIALGIIMIFTGYTLSVELVKKFFEREFMDIISTIIMIIGGLLYTLVYYLKKD